MAYRSFFVPASALPCMVFAGAKTLAECSRTELHPSLMRISAPIRCRLVSATDVWEGFPDIPYQRTVRPVVSSILVVLPWSSTSEVALPVLQASQHLQLLQQIWILLNAKHCLKHSFRTEACWPSQWLLSPDYWSGHPFWPNSLR